MNLIRTCSGFLGKATATGNDLEQSFSDTPVGKFVSAIVLVAAVGFGIWANYP